MERRWNDVIKAYNVKKEFYGHASDQSFLRLSIHLFADLEHDKSMNDTYHPAYTFREVMVTKTNVQLLRCYDAKT